FAARCPQGLRPAKNDQELLRAVMEVVIDSTRAWRQLPDRTRERHPILADQPTAADPFPHLWKVWLPHVGAVILGYARTLTHMRAPRAQASVRVVWSVLEGPLPGWCRPCRS